MPPNQGGFRPLEAAAGEPHVARTELAQPPGTRLEPLLAVAHLSDLHVCDHQSPARVEFLDRWADPDSPILEQLGEVGAYRTNELLNVQVVEACVRAVNAVAAGPVTGAPLDLAISTGDNTDNSQANELSWYLDLLDGGRVHPDSGDLTRYEGIADDVVWDERYWHPDTDKPDLLRALYGFPDVPGLLDEVRRPFEATGLRTPWLAVHGNHDQLLQGTVPGAGRLAQVAVGGAKPIALPVDWTTDQVLAADGRAGRLRPGRAARRWSTRSCARSRPMPGRRLVSRRQFVQAHARERARPARHGFTTDDLAYYRHDRGRVSFLVLDTVNEHGGWEGSLDPAQLDWLDTELAAADADAPLRRGGEPPPAGDAGQPDRRRPDARARRRSGCSPRTPARCSGWPATPTRRRSRPTATTGRWSRRRWSTGPSRPGSSSCRAATACCRSRPR